MSRDHLRSPVPLLQNDSSPSSSPPSAGIADIVKISASENSLFSSCDAVTEDNRQLVQGLAEHIVYGMCYEIGELQLFYIKLL